MVRTTRRIPRSNIRRAEALTRATMKKDSSPPSGNVLSATTTARLSAIAPRYQAALLEVDVKKALLNQQVAIKNAKKEEAKVFISVFIQSFILGVRIGVFRQSELAYFGLDTSHPTVPYLGNEQSIITLGKRIKAGDAQRTAHGGAAMAVPTIANFATVYDAYIAAFTRASNLKDDLDTARETLATLNTEANKVILKVWDEVETFYNEEPKASQRDQAREWGVVYVNIGRAPSVLGQAKAATPAQASASLLPPASPDTPYNTDENEPIDTAHTDIQSIDNAIKVSGDQLQTMLALIVEDAMGKPVPDTVPLGAG